jgi:hypothetical protein
MNNKHLVSLLCLIILAIALFGTVIYISDINIALAQEINHEENERSVKVEIKEDLEVKEEVLSYISETRDDDPFIEVESNIFIKESNYKGITINDKTYFYSLSPHMSYDPVTRGEVEIEDVNVIYNDNDAEAPVIIYTIRP